MTDLTVWMQNWTSAVFLFSEWVNESVGFLECVSGGVVGARAVKAPFQSWSRFRTDLRVCDALKKKSRKTMESTKSKTLIAKSPSSEKTLLSSNDGSYKEANLLLLVSNLQVVSGLLMLIFGVLCAVYELSMSRLGAGLWGGMVSLLAGSLGTAATLNSCLSRRSSSLYLTLYLALCLVSLAVNTLVVVLTLTALVRDSRQDPEYFSIEQSRHWAGQWCGIGLLGATALHLVCTLVSIPISCKKSCVNHENGHDLQDAKHHLVRSWLGSHNPNFLNPHHLLVEGQTVYTVPYPQSFTPVHPPRHYRQRPQVPRPAEQAISETGKKKRKPKPITDEDLEKTYTGLDREIAEEFISIAMQPKPPSSRTESTISQIIP